MSMAAKLSWQSRSTSCSDESLSKPKSLRRSVREYGTLHNLSGPLSGMFLAYSEDVQSVHLQMGSTAIGGGLFLFLFFFSSTAS